MKIQNSKFVFNLPEKYDVTFEENMRKFYINGRTLYDYTSGKGILKISMSKENIESMLAVYDGKVPERGLHFLVPLPTSPEITILSFMSVKGIESILEDEDNNYLIRYDKKKQPPKGIDNTIALLNFKSNYRPG
ncbi:MAG TPA: hypothetical protein VEC16_01740 [Alphaproteobacteria bacterium]|nr:hypothetical protein [Alphaproteobacteria bacterium]